MNFSGRFGQGQVAELEGAGRRSEPGPSGREAVASADDAVTPTSHELTAKFVSRVNRSSSSSSSSSRHHVQDTSRITNTMALRVEERWLWLGLGVFVVAAAAKGIHHALTDMVRLTELDPAQFPADDHHRHHGKHPDECVDLRTLRTLCMSPNPSIAAAAQSLVMRRFAALPNAAEILARDRESEDPDTSRKAVQAIKYLRDYDMEFGISMPPHMSLDDTMDFLNTMNHDPDVAVDEVTYRDENGESTVMHGTDWDSMARELNRRQHAFDADRGFDVVARLEELSEEIARTERNTGLLQARIGWDGSSASREPFAITGGGRDERRRRHREVMVLHEGNGRIEEEDIISPSSLRRL